ncbi:ferredoxin reductase-like C-terminal NADP-linked domain-containing protein [Obba rivulosa]|uniref:Ferredoxin reductase-like C-terminal NADP-linked domain-containing protein n=1 Tax=Obba rivulosa TaxID=1052685 RepID=A0A8E2B593_9APHY|nr:ferredoxin reductase-like C-terminal NADP-linked domain-containing protein [Obba rivulosa]
MLACSRSPLSSCSRLISHSRRHLPQNLLYSRRYASTSSPPERSARSKIFISLGLLTTGSLVGTYFLWPDNSRSAPTYENSLLSSRHFTPVTVTASEPCPDPNTRLITLTVPPQSIPPQDDALASPIWSIFIKDDDIQVERPYTPLEGIDEHGRMKFWIKQYPKGEVGRWLLSKNVGDRIEIRGSIKTWPWKDETWDEIVMISGGTGITPFYQLLHHTILRGVSESQKTRFTLIHSSRTPAGLPPPEMLDPLLKASRSNPESFSISLFVDEFDGSNHPCMSSSDLHVGRISKTSIERALRLDINNPWWRKLLRLNTPMGSDKSKKVLFLVCGPDPMIASIAGPWGRNYSQGEVGGILGTLGFTRVQVRKL